MEDRMNLPKQGRERLPPVLLSHRKEEERRDKVVRF
jgi:hypothetical protein